MNTKTWLAFLLIFPFLHAGAQQRAFSITAYGAKADAVTSNTIAIQKAIDAAHAAGGGKVRIPAGKFVTGVIQIKSGVTLQLDAGSELLGSAKRSDYGASDASALIVATNQKRIGITGKGTINGQGPALLKDIYRMLNDGSLQDSEWKTENPWHQIRPEERNRPKIIEFINCDSVQIKGITIRDGLCWVQNYKNCSHLLVDSIQVESNIFWNNDGIDIVDCVHARVTNSFFNADDDGICLKSEDRNRRCEDVYVANCKVRSSASAIKFGTASRGGFKDITVKNIVVYDTYRSAIALEAVDGGVLENVRIDNVKATNTGNAIFIRLGHRNRDSVVSRVKGVHISNVTAQIPAGKPDKGYPMEGPVVDARHNVFPSSVSGLPGHPVEDVLLENIHIQYEGGARKDSAFVSINSLGSITENVPGYPEFSMFGELPCWGFYMRHVNGITLKNCTLRFGRDDFRAAMVLDDVKKPVLQHLTISTGKTLPVLVFRKSDKPVLQQLQLPLKDKEAVKYIE